MGAKIAIEPDPVEQGNTITVAVDIQGGGEPPAWHMRIVSAQDSSVVLAPRGLDAYGVPVVGKAGAYECKISTGGFKPGEYLVDLAPGGKFNTPEMASKKFTVEPSEIIAVSMGKRYPEDYAPPGSRYGRI